MSLLCVYTGYLKWPLQFCLRVLLAHLQYKNRSLEESKALCVLGVELARPQALIREPGTHRMRMR